MIRRAALIVLSCAAVVSGMLALAAPASAAANPGSVTVDGSGGNLSASASSVSGSVGDTFSIAFANGAGSLSVTGSAVSSGGSSCSSGCSVSTGSSALFTIVASGSLSLVEYGSPITLTIIVGAAAADVTMTFDANGGVCNPNTLSIAGADTSGYSLPADGTGEGQCHRDNYTLAGWADSSTATTVGANLGAGASNNFHSPGGTLYAVWVPDGVEVTYDANVGADVPCLNSSGAEVALADRSSTSIVPAASDLATSAPCAPDNPQLAVAGWATSGDGPVAYAPGSTFAAAGMSQGSRVHLYAVWQSMLTIACTQTRGLPLFTFSCTDFGKVPVGSRAVLEVRVTNESKRSSSLVASAWPPQSDLNGQLEAAPKAGDCGAGTIVPGGGSCTLHYAWTPSAAGALASSDIPLTVCSAGNINSCYRTYRTQGLRGNAVNPYGVTVSGQGTLGTDGALTVSGTALRNGAPVAHAIVGISADGAVRLSRPASETSSVTTNADGTFETTIIGSSSPGTGTITVAYGDQTASATFTVAQAKSITIMGERGTVKGKPGVLVDGLTTGFAVGDVVIPHIKFPGQTSYSEGTERPTVDARGGFSWQRKTGKKIYIYFSNEDGRIRSDRIIIQAK